MININALAYNALVTNKDYLDIDGKKYTINKSKTLRSILSDEFRYVMFVENNEIYKV